MYQHDFLENFDLGLLCPDAGMTSSLLQHGEGYHQYLRQQQDQLSLAERMQGDKQDMLYSMTAAAKFEIEYETLEASSGLHEMMELGELEEVKMEPEIKDENDHQPLIDQVEEFLQQYKDLQVDQEQPIFEECPLNSTLISEDDKISAENLINQLFLDSIAIDLNDEKQNDFADSESSFTTYEDDVAAQADDIVDDSGFVDNASGFVDNDAGKLNTSEIIMPDGTKLIFVIAPQSPESSQICVSSPAASDFVASPSSPDYVESLESNLWSPESATSSVRGRRKPYERKGGVRKAKLTVVDKKERKKIQNVEAARRYRDKKKSEQQLIDEELEELTIKNNKLKRKVSEKESELKTLKKLMADMGLIKISSRK